MPYQSLSSVRYLRTSAMRLHCALQMHILDAVEFLNSTELVCSGNSTELGKLILIYK